MGYKHEIRMSKVERKANIAWIRAYLECLFEHHPVTLLEGQAHQLELILERP